MSSRWFLFPSSIFVLILGWHLEAYATSLRLQWTDVSNNESGFKVERMASTGSYTQLATVPANVQTYTDTGLNSGTTYCYKVRAFNSAGTSAPSNAGCTTAPTTATSTPPSSTGSSTGSTTTSPPTSPSGTIARLSSKWSDYRVSMKMRSQDNDRLGVMFRYQDNENYYRFSWHGQAKYRRLEKRVGGVFKTLAEDAAAYTVGQTYALRIIAQGSSLKVLIDGKTIFSVVDSSFSDGTIALYSFVNAGSWFDDVIVEELPSGKVLLSDNFNDRDHVGWTIVDEAEDSVPSEWSAATGALVQSSNSGSGNTNGIGTYALFTRGSWQDYRVALKMRSADNDPLGVLFRFQDSENYYRFSWDRETAGRRLMKREQGVFKLLAKDSVPYIAGRNYQVEVIAQGSSLKVKVDGKPAFSVTDQSFKTGTVALYSSMNKGSVFDDVLVEELPTEAVLLWDNFNNGDSIGWTIFDEAGAKSGPSVWSVVKGELVQSSNIGSDGTSGVGTFVMY
jgi:Domain of Unknown Function (DUF1080)/Fibronectin type III domain